MGDMMATKKTISFSDYAWDQVKEAEVIWPEHAHSLSETVCKIIAEWGRSMSNGGKTERVIGRIDDAEGRIIGEVRSIAAAKAAGCDCVTEFDSEGYEK
jgi:hypothetical protein